MNDIQQQFRDGAEAYAQRLRDERERRENPRKNTDNNADAFKEHIEQQLAEQRANGTRIDITNL